MVCNRGTIRDICLNSPKKYQDEYGQLYSPDNISIRSKKYQKIECESCEIYFKNIRNHISVV